jgi:hypothetical protein
VKPNPSKNLGNVGNVGKAQYLQGFQALPDQSRPGNVGNEPVSVCGLHYQHYQTKFAPVMSLVMPKPLQTLGLRGFITTLPTLPEKNGKSENYMWKG